MTNNLGAQIWGYNCFSNFRWRKFRRWQAKWVSRNQAWFSLKLFACHQRNFSHGICVEWWNEQNRTKKYLSLCSHLKFKYFNFCEIFSQRNQSDFFLDLSGHFTRIKKFSQNGWPTAFSCLREDLSQYILKTRIIELQTSFRLREFSMGLYENGD